MKKSYEKPEANIYFVEMESFLLAASGRELLIEEIKGYDDEGMFLPGRR